MAMKMKSEVASKTQAWVGNLQSPMKVQVTKILLKPKLKT